MKGSDNSFPSILVTEGTVPATPAAGTQRLYIDSTTHLLKVVNSSGTASNVGSGGSGTVTTVEEVDGSPTDSAVTKIVFPNGTLGIASHVATYTPAAPTLIEYTLGADVTMTSVNTVYDGPSGTPAAGTYDIFARLCLLNNSASAEIFTGRLYAGSTVIDEVEQAGYVQSAGIAVGLVLMARAVLNGSTVVKASALAAAGTSRVIKRDPATNSSGVHRASIVTLVQVA